MLNLEELIKTVEKQQNMTEEEKKNYEPLAFALGNFLNAIWETSDKNRKE